MYQRPFRCCGKYTHLRVLRKELGKRRTREHLARMNHILAIGETSVTPFLIRRRRRYLIVKIKRENDRLLVTDVCWQGRIRVPPRSVWVWWIKNGPYVLVSLLIYLSRELIKLVFRRFFPFE